MVGQAVPPARARLLEEGFSVPQSHTNPATHLEALVEPDEILSAAEIDHVRALEESEHPAHELGADPTPRWSGTTSRSVVNALSHVVSDSRHEADDPVAVGITRKDDDVSALQQLQVFGRRGGVRQPTKKPTSRRGLAHGHRRASSRA